MTTVYVSTVETAKMIRAALKRAFPGVKFSVRSDSYAGGSSIDISYTDGPALKSVELIAHAFRGSDFDGMTDCRMTRAVELNGVRTVYGPDHEFVSQKLSPARREATAAALRALTDGERALLAHRLGLHRFETTLESRDFADLVVQVARAVAA